MKRAFEGVKVLTFGWIQTAPRTIRFLADYGAEVIRVESTKNLDVMRAGGSARKGDIGGPNLSASWADINRNIYGMTLNLRHPRAAEITPKLIAWADIVAENFAPGTMDRLGLGYKDLVKIKPDIIMISMSNQGSTGRRASVPGLGSHLAALTGICHLAGWPDRSPVQPHGYYTDNIGPRIGATVLVAALAYRHRTGKGQFIDVSQFEAGLHFLAPVYLDYAVNGRETMRMGNRCPYVAPHGVYRCRGEDRWCAITISNDEEWQTFCKVIGRPAWTKEVKFSTLLERKKNEDELDRLIEEWTVNYSAEDIMTLMQTAGVDTAVVQNNEDAINDPQLKYRNYYVEIEHPDLEKQLCMDLGFRLSKTPAEIRMPAPNLGQHNEYVCKQILGFSDEEFVSLLVDDIFS